MCCVEKEDLEIQNCQMMDHFLHNLISFFFFGQIGRNFPEVEVKQVSSYVFLFVTRVYPSQCDVLFGLLQHGDICPASQRPPNL